MAGRKILVLFAHPALEKSRINRVLIHDIERLDGVTFHDLYEAYPDLHIDVAREQQLLLDHDIVIWHHPFYWYSTPAMLKEWQDLVLEHGWAYGSAGTRLHGKYVMNAVTAGGRETSYGPDGMNHHTVRQLLAPMEQTAALCGMVYLAPFIVHGTHAMAGPEEAESHRRDYRRVLSALHDGRFNVNAAADRSLPHINDALDRLVRETEGPHVR